MRAGIIGAMEMEVASLKERLSGSRTESVSGMDFYIGTLGTTETVVVKCGVGKVNAAICTQILIGHFKVDCVINTGVAGSLDAKINIGDFVVSEDALQYDVDVSIFGYERGQIPGFAAAAFPADDKLAALAEETCRRVNPDISVYRGRVVTGDMFVADASKKEELASVFHGSCTEMEGAAIAQTAWLNQVPFVIVRAISDKADGSDVVDYPVFEAKAAADCARLVENMIRTVRN